MITDNNNNWHYLAVKSVSGLLKLITSKHKGEKTYTTEKKLKKHESICKDHDFCHVKIPREDNKILKYNSGEKSLKVPFIIYADLECLFKKINACQNNPEKSYTEKKPKYIPSGYSLINCCSFDNTKKRKQLLQRKRLYEDILQRFKRPSNENN